MMLIVAYDILAAVVRRILCGGGVVLYVSQDAGGQMMPQKDLLADPDFGLVAKGANAIVLKGDGSVPNLQGKWAGVLSMVSWRQQ